MKGPIPILGARPLRAARPLRGACEPVNPHGQQARCTLLTWEVLQGRELCDWHVKYVTLHVTNPLFSRRQ